MGQGVTACSSFQSYRYSSYVKKLWDKVYFPFKPVWVKFKLLKPKLQSKFSTNSELPTSHSQEIPPCLSMALGLVPPKKCSLAEKSRSHRHIWWDTGGFCLEWKTLALGFLPLCWAWIHSVPSCPSSPFDRAVVGRNQPQVAGTIGSKERGSEEQQEPGFSSLQRIEHERDPRTVPEDRCKLCVPLTSNEEANGYICCIWAVVSPQHIQADPLLS